VTNSCTSALSIKDLKLYLDTSGIMNKVKRPYFIKVRPMYFCGPASVQAAHLAVLSSIRIIEKKFMLTWSSNNFINILSEHSHRAVELKKTPRLLKYLTYLFNQITI
jgi:hypothetical protein